MKKLNYGASAFSYVEHICIKYFIRKIIHQSKFRFESKIHTWKNRRRGLGGPLLA